MKFIPLTKGKFALVDDQDFEFLSQWKWHAHRSDDCWYARRSVWTPPVKTIVSMHAQIISPPLGFNVDHRDGDGLNNQRFNLRQATQKQNCCNQRLKITNTSGYKGVYFNRKCEKWVAQIQNGKSISLGLFLSPEDAARPYDQEALRLWGEFSKTNQSLGLLIKKQR